VTLEVSQRNRLAIRVLTAGLLAAAMFVLAACSEPSDDPKPRPSTDDGPLDGSGTTRWFDRMKVDDQFTNGFTYLENLGDVSVTITDVEPRLRGETLKFLGARQLDGERLSPNFDRVFGWPKSYSSKDRIHDLGSVPVRPAASAQKQSERAKIAANILMGFKVVAPGMTRMSGVTVSYTDGQETWTEYFKLGMVIRSS